MENIVSNAFNFSEFVDSGVDPRTGSYSISFTLGELLSNKLSGPNFKLTISHNYLNKVDEGFGLGWSISMSSYDKISRKLSLSSGRTFETVLSKESNELIILHRKTKDVRAFLVENEREIKVVYIDGKVEYIDYESGKLIKTVSNLGHEIFFYYRYLNGLLSLSKISDQFGHSITIDHWSNKYYTIINSVAENDIYKRNYLLSKISHGYGRILTSISMVNSSNLKTTIDYKYIDKLGNYAIIQVKHYSGLVETIEYSYEGHLLPNKKNNFNFIPNVKRHTLYPGSEQPKTVYEYEYSLKNYLGYGSNLLWEDGVDVLFYTASDYRYSSQEVMNGSHIIERVYNKYHLLESEKYFRNGVLYKEIDLEYYADLTQGIDEQPNNYSYKKKESITFHLDGIQRTEVSEYGFDDYGNCIFECDKDGTTSFFEYYPCEGEQNQCPAHPYQFICYLKSVETHPVSNTHGENILWNKYKYSLVSNLNDCSYIAESEMNTSHGETTKNHYFDDPNQPRTCGLVSNIEISLNDELCGILSFSYDLNNNERITHITMTGFDGQCATKSEAQNIYSGNLIYRVDHDGLITRYTYNENGQYTSIVVAPDTEKYSIKEFDYDCSSDGNSLLITGSQGHKQKFIYDGMGRQLYQLSEDNSGHFKIIEEIHYNENGEVDHSIERDWFGDHPMEYTTHYYYDLFGELSTTIRPSGNILISEFNPVKLTSKTGIEGLSYDIILNDINGKPLEETRFTSQGVQYSISKRYYDSHGQTIKATDPFGFSSYYTYDALGRSLSVTDPNGIVKSVCYSPYSLNQLITEISVSGKVVGERVYDGLQRIVSETQAGRKTHYSYDGCQINPSRMITAKECVWSFVYDPLLKKNIRAFTNSIEQTFDYHPTTSKLITSDNGISKNIYEYDKQGRVVQEIRIIDGKQYESSYVYSLLGKLLIYSDYLGNIERYNYDENGSLIEIEKIVKDTKYITTFEYDNYNRLSYQSCYCCDKPTINRLEHYIYFDDFSREINRIVISSGIIIYSIAIEYDISDRIILKEKSREGVVLLSEEFDYDKKNRLIRYNASGVEHPKNASGFPFHTQIFTYDFLDNIETVTTIFIDGDQDVESYFYENPDDPTQLSRIEHSHPEIDSVSIAYDEQGNIIIDEQQRLYIYDDNEHLVLVKNKLNEIISSYSYNAEGQLICQHTVDDGSIYYLYRGDQLVNEINGDIATSYLRYVNKPILRLYHHDGTTSPQFLATDKSGSIISEFSFDEFEDIHHIYTPFGFKYNPIISL
ncbi:RHS repeat protein [Vibrio navarrensis]|uniref:RHS repeat protein n=1 Tax=Vibrio navarrensis TaxID=29495 RepID=UPI00186A949D|nr:RHS repeat protein [Vibrio navarrensis]MBE4605676.1 hypothetical protein [Vibrio navarrensis]